MPRLRQNEREQAVGMLLAGMAQTQIANHFNVSRMTIYRLMIRLRDTAIRQTVHVFTVVAENASLTLVCWKQTVLAEVAS